MEKPNVSVLARVPWSLFCSFTFVRENMPEGLRRRYFFSFLRICAGDVGIHFHRLLWMLRPEAGEITGRRHYHALIGGIPPHVLTPRLCLRLMAQWEHQKPLAKRRGPDGKLRELSRFCGMPRIRIFSPDLDGLDYLLPDGSEGGDSGYSLSGANSYESKKFGGLETVELSESLGGFFRAQWKRGGARHDQAADLALCGVVQSRQREVSASHSCVCARESVSPAPLFAGPRPGAAVYQVAANASSLPKRPRAVMTGDRLTTWRESRPGVYEQAQG